MLAKLVRLGRDAEVRYTAKGDPVASLAMVYDVGFGDSKRAQWVDGTLWGKRAESLGPYLTKGTQVVLYADDVELEQFMKKDGTPGAKLKCRVSDLSLVSGGPSVRSGHPPAKEAQNAEKAKAAVMGEWDKGPGKGNGFDDDIPFQEAVMNTQIGYSIAEKTKIGYSTVQVPVAITMVSDQALINELNRRDKMVKWSRKRK